jgi:hypothetical protein
MRCSYKRRLVHPPHRRFAADRCAVVIWLPVLAGSGLSWRWSDHQDGSGIPLIAGVSPADVHGVLVLPAASHGIGDELAHRRVGWRSPTLTSCFVQKRTFRQRRIDACSSMVIGSEFSTACGL